MTSELKLIEQTCSNKKCANKFKVLVNDKTRFCSKNCKVNSGEKQPHAWVKRVRKK